MPPDIETLQGPEGEQAAETAGQGTLPEQWSQASAARKSELAAEAMRKHGKQVKAAASLGISRQRLAKVLHNSSATVASKFPTSPWKPHKT
jgi:DNA-binding NtrC family response regulator